MDDGHVAGQETPNRQWPHGLSGVDVSPEITSLSEDPDPLGVLVFRRRLTRCDTRDLVYAVRWFRGGQRSVQSHGEGDLA